MIINEFKSLGGEPFLPFKLNYLDNVEEGMVTLQEEYNASSFKKITDIHDPELLHSTYIQRKYTLLQLLINLNYHVLYNENFGLIYNEACQSLVVNSFKEAINVVNDLNPVLSIICHPKVKCENFNNRARVFKTDGILKSILLLNFDDFELDVITTDTDTFSSVIKDTKFNEVTENNTMKGGVLEFSYKLNQINKNPKLYYIKYKE